MIVDFSRMIVGASLLAIGCGKPVASADIPGRADGPSSPGDGPSSPDDGPAGPSDGPGHPPDGPGVDAVLLDAPGHTPGMPGLGAHAMGFYHLAMSNASSITTPVMATRPSGSTIVVGVGRGDNTLFALPTDNKGNVPYRQLDIMHPYLHPFETSGTALYAFTSATGGADFKVTTTTGPISTGQGDEITLAAVEVIEGTRIQDLVWNVIAQQSPAIPVTSRSVTTTGPATLIALWWGDAFPGTPQSATPNNGFVVVDTNAQETGSFVQCAVAVKSVAGAGTYNVTWTSTPEQGAQLWLVAVQ